RTLVYKGLPFWVFVLKLVAPKNMVFRPALGQRSNIPKALTSLRIEFHKSDVVEEVSVSGIQNRYVYELETPNQRLYQDIRTNYIFGHDSISNHHQVKYVMLIIDFQVSKGEKRLYLIRREDQDEFVTVADFINAIEN